jgi:hypothetical protein
MRKAHTKAGPEYKFNITQKFINLHYYKPGFSHIKVKVFQSLNNGTKTSRRHTWEAIHRVSLINIVLPRKLPTIWNRTRPDGVTWKPQQKQGWVY